MRKDLIDRTAKVLKTEKRDLIEKDIIIHELLTDLSKEKFFSENFLFKGGTCLVKAFFGYYRFSEDIDFTWKQQEIFQGKSGGKIYSEISPILDNIGKIFEASASRRGLNFVYKKDDDKYVEITGSGKMCTFYIRYTSEITKNESFIKVQINFIEKICFDLASNSLISLVHHHDTEELSILFEKNDYLEKINFSTYDIKEILCEKIRAILTRQGTKARDFLDVYLICKNQNIDLDNVENEIVEKLKFALDNYQKYRENFKAKIPLIEKEQLFDWGEEKYFLLQDVDDEDFYPFIEKLNTFLKKIIQQINSH